MDSKVELDVLKKIKEKKELSDISNEIVLSEIRKSGFNLKKELKEKEIKEIVKEVRAKLRKYSGRFQYSNEERLSLLKTGKIKDLLKTHSSTLERLDFYPQFKEIIDSLHARSILDIGCGLNPIALAKKGQEYYAYDIKEKELNLIHTFFQINGIKGETGVCDLRDIERPFPKTDLCLVLKVFDVLETNGHKLAEKIINNIKSRIIIISFPTKTLSGRPMNHPQRGWIERLLSRLGFTFKIIKSKNEIFYIAERPI